jgi:hypothetical protein
MNRAHFVIILISGLLFISLNLSVWAQGAERQELLSKDVEGVAAVKNNDLAKAREEAIKDALQKAVNEAEAELVREGAMASLKPRHLTTERYVRSYRMLSEKQIGVVYKVGINVIIDALLLIDDHKARTVKQPLKKIALTVRGITSYADYIQFRDHLDTHIRHCGQASPEMIAWHMAEFRVDICESPEAFANALAQSGPFAMNVRRAVVDVVEMEVVER